MSNLAILEGNVDFTCGSDLMGFSFGKAWRKAKRVTKRVTRKATKVASVPFKVAKKANRYVLQKTLGKKMYSKIARSPYINPLKMGTFIIKKAKKYAEKSIKKAVGKQVRKLFKNKSLNYVKRNANNVANTVAVAVSAATAPLVITAFPGVGAGLIPFIGITTRQIVKTMISGIIKAMKKAAKKLFKQKTTSPKRRGIRKPRLRIKTPKFRFPKSRITSRPSTKKPINPIALAVPAIAALALFL